MPEKKRHVVSVYSQEISLWSSESDEYMQKLANYVDIRIKEFAKNVSRISFGDLCLLTCLSIADDYFKSKEVSDGFGDKEAELEDEIAEAMTKVMILEAREREKEIKIEELEEQVRILKASLEDKTNTREALKQKLNVLSYELQKPLEKRNFEQDLEEANEIIETVIKE